jgi:DNA-binding NtrC family response regulator
MSNKSEAFNEPRVLIAQSYSTISLLFKKILELENINAVVFVSCKSELKSICKTFKPNVIISDETLTTPSFLFYARNIEHNVKIILTTKEVDLINVQTDDSLIEEIITIPFDVWNMLQRIKLIIKDAQSVMNHSCNGRKQGLKT